MNKALQVLLIARDAIRLEQPAILTMIPPLTQEQYFVAHCVQQPYLTTDSVDKWVGQVSSRNAGCQPNKRCFW